MNMTRAFSSLLTPTRMLVVAAAALGVATFAAPRPADAAPMLKASPANVVVPAGQATGNTVLSWNTDSNTPAEIWLTVDGGPESPALFNGAPQGSMNVPVMPGHTFVFKLYVGPKGNKPAAATVTVKASYAKSDLTVKYDGFINGKLRVTVKNQGGSPSGAFRIAVLAGADSYSINALSLSAGQSRQYALHDDLEGCNRPVAILVDVDHEVDESVENNNGTGFNAPCQIDPGVIAIPEDD